VRRQAGVGTDVAFAQHDFIDATRRHASGAGEGVLADATRCEEFFEQHFAGVDVGQLFMVFLIPSILVPPSAFALAAPGIP
jgi:hypothetical protein